MSKSIVVQDGAHSELGPSSAKRWMNCPASVKATRGVPDQQTIYAASGTASHWLAERCHNEGVRADAYLGSTIVVGEHKCEVDRARIDSINAFLDYCADVGGDVFCEERVSYECDVPGGFGTSDRCQAVGDTLHIIDLKDGEGVQVFAEKCEQLMLYARGWLLKYLWVYPEITKVVLHIAQPRLGHFDKWETTVNQIEYWACLEVQPAAQLALSDNAPFNAGPWCSQNFCRIRRTCKHRAEALMKEVVNDFTDLDAPVKSLPTLSNDDMARIYARVPEITKWIGEIKAHVMSELQHGHPVGGLKLVAGKSSRGWTKNPSEVATALELEGVEPYEKKLISVAKAETAIGKKKFKSLEAEMSAKTPGRPTIATNDDKRPALTVDALQEFEDLGQQAEDDGSNDAFLN